ncbi:MBL fold metallo-hydrolase, partial [Acinetobacter baumannii]
MSITVTPISAFNDNYIWLLSDGKYAVVVDPGQAAPVISALEEQGLTLTDILITHHHPDHVGGIPALKYFASESLKRIIGPA